MAQANRALKQLPEDIALEVRTVTGTTAFNVARQAAADIPLSEGQPQGRAHLRELVSWAWTGKLAAVVRVDKEGFFWKYLEYGTKFIPARGMFRRAADANRTDHAGRLQNALERANSKLNQ